MGWFKNWFGTEYYKVLYSHRDDGEAKQFLEDLNHTFNWPKGTPILDVACGKGRHSRTLAEMGFDVTGIDVVEENIKFAAQYSADNLHFEVQDMREPFCVEGFDVALNLFTSFGYFDKEEEDLASLRNIYNALNNNGLFIMDFLNAFPVKERLVPKETITREGLDFDINRFVKNGYVIKEIVVHDNGSEHHFKEKVKLLELEDFEKYFSQTGFIMENIFGNYRLEPYLQERSERLIMVARKK